MVKKQNIILKIVLIIIGVFIIVQFVPYGHSHINPPVVGEPKWDSPQTESLFYRACGNCHSNKTSWPWYSNIAPASWLVQSDVDEAREDFNVSEWVPGRTNHGSRAAEEVREGDMPPFQYLIMHPEARLSKTEKDALIRGLIKTFGESGK
ncbi:MAG: heme-binding domain-containing protein [Candidatus Kryptoniota bacterium]